MKKKNELAKQTKPYLKLEITSQIKNNAYVCILHWIGISIKRIFNLYYK
jgi:hypothetical protein